MIFLFIIIYGIGDDADFDAVDIDEEITGIFFVREKAGMETVSYTHLATMDRSCR